MKYSKKIIVSIVILAVFTVVSLNMNALASTMENPFETTFSNNIVDENVTTEGIESVNTIKDGNKVENNVANNTTPDELANTGLEDLPYLVITLLIASAVFAYRKVKEYRQY